MALNTQQEMFCREFIACKYNAGTAYEKVYATKKNDSARAGAVRNRSFLKHTLSHKPCPHYIYKQ